jgi:hypothetical protein
MDEQQKPILIEMAEYWTTLAERAERGEKIDGEISLAPIVEQLKTNKQPLSGGSPGKPA